MATPRLPVFAVVLNGGKACRIIDAETNNPARDQWGDALDGGGMANVMLAEAHARRINAERGVSSDQGPALARAYRANVLGTQATASARRELDIPPEFRTREMSKKEAARYLGISVDTLQRRIKSGRYACDSSTRDRHVFDLRDFPPAERGHLAASHSNSPQASV